MDDDWGGPLAQADLNNELFIFCGLVGWSSKMTDSERVEGRGERTGEVIVQTLRTLKNGRCCIGL